ncbi:hypothetical protein [Rhizobium sp. FKY42]|uniref:hypothetical protein n=1 Tax=Rhizobium sp. FKY42 TaxID=2562310 RepID=UPI0010BF809E|nr:hypothetical protein [Rhizobium sp. FKY42]
MSIVRQLIQLSIVEALRDQTMAGDCVFDSRMERISGLAEEQAVPVIVVSVETADQSDQTPGGIGLLGRDTSLSVLIQTAVVTARKVKDDNGTVIRQGIGETDAALEGALNILDRQWRHVLHTPESEWAEVFRDLVLATHSVKDTRAADPDTKRKHAARFVQIDLDVLPDPLPGDELPEAIERGLALMAADPEYAELAADWRALLAKGRDWPEWRKLQSRLFATRKDMATIGLGPLDIDELVPFTHARLNVRGMQPMEFGSD